ncbi:MAG: two-component regulator propeller domain-containing protein [Planctomycetota bacterium]
MLTPVFLAAACASAMQPAPPQQNAPEPLVITIHHDKQGRYWFGTAGHGVYRFDGKTMHYHAFPIDIPEDQHDLYSVTAIDQSSAQTVWIAT